MTTQRIDLPNNITWLDILSPSEREVDDIMQRYDFHDLDRDAIMEENQRDRVDTYEDYIFMILHFPKYNTKTKRYVLSEFNVFLSRQFFIQFRHLPSTTVTQVMELYRRRTDDDTVNTAYILYDLLDAMFDKMFRLMDNFARDLKGLETTLFTGNDKHLISEIMIKKRNIILLKHIMKPHLQVLKILELRVKNIFQGEVELYFENLQDKAEQIYAEILLQQENIESIEETLKSIFDMETNNIIKYLTLFSAFMLPLTFLTGFFGMNIVSVPFSDWLVIGAIVGTTVFMTVAIWLLKKFRKI